MKRIVGTYATGAVVALALTLAASACTFSFGSPEPSPTRAPVPRAKPSPAPDQVDAAATDIEAFWSGMYPELYGDAYLDVELVLGIETTSDDVPECGGEAVTNDDWIGNAFYCYGENYIAYDARPNGLIVQLALEHGQPSVSAVFAHEWGHAIQDRSGNTRVPTIYAELQADCFAGAWVAHAADNPGDHFVLTPGDLDRILGAMLSFRDAPGSEASAANAHGSGFDRVSAFQDGYEGGAEVCVPYFDDPPFITEIPFTTRQEIRSGGNAPAEQVLPATVEMLNDFYGKVARRDYVPVKTRQVFTWDESDPPDEMPTCGTIEVTPEQLTNQVFICGPDRYLVVDVVYLQRVYDEIGDFGVSTIIAQEWATYAQLLQSIEGAGTDALASAADCYTGGFAAALVNGELRAKSMGGFVQISGGDLDEAIQAFIDADRVQGAEGDEVFNHVDNFRGGFLEGYVSCKQHLP